MWFGQGGLGVSRGVNKSGTAVRSSSDWQHCQSMPRERDGVRERGRQGGKEGKREGVGEKVRESPPPSS